MDSVPVADLDRLAVEFLNEWIAEDPERKVAIGNYYVKRLERQRLFQPYDQAVAQYAARLFPAGTRFIEVGSGLGELGILLSVNSFRLTGFEFTKGRQLGALALTAKLAAAGFSLPNLSFLHARYPDDLTLKMINVPERKVFVATGTTSSFMRGKMEAILRSLSLFDDVILDVRSFGFSRSDAEAEDLTATLFASGFEAAGTVYVTNAMEIYHFTRGPVSIANAPDTQAHVSIRAAPMLYSESGDAVPARLRRQPFHVFSGLEVPLRSVFPDLEHMPPASMPAEPGWVTTFQSPAGDPTAVPPDVDGTDWRSWKYTFAAFGPHYVTSHLGTFKCLLLDPAGDRDSHAFAIFRFVAANTLHSDVDRITIAPWPKRPRYVRPDLLLPKLFMSDQPLGLQCSHVADVLAYLLQLAGYEARRVGVVDPDVGTHGHTVVETFLPGQQRWVMLDADFGVLVADSEGHILSVAEVVERHSTPDALEVVKAVEKRWLPPRYHTAIGYRGHRSWGPDSPLGNPTVVGRSYHEVIQRCFRNLSNAIYSFNDGFANNTTIVE